MIYFFWGGALGGRCSEQRAEESVLPQERTVDRNVLIF
jgi:hypothetical protein